MSKRLQWPRTNRPPMGMTIPSDPTTGALRPLSPFGTGSQRTQDLWLSAAPVSSLGQGQEGDAGRREFDWTRRDATAFQIGQLIVAAKPEFLPVQANAGTLDLLCR